MDKIYTIQNSESALNYIIKYALCSLYGNIKSIVLAHVLFSLGFHGAFSHQQSPCVGFYLHNVGYK
jgi:hypothetical protein